MPKPQLTTANIANALERTAGNVYLAAKALGVARSALYKKINESEELQQALADAREAIVDIAETSLRQQVVEGNITAVIFTLKTLGRQRGYIEHQRMDVHIGNLETFLSLAKQKGVDPAELIKALTDELGEL